MFNPIPIDTSNITLNTDLTALIEMLAENTHNVWAQARIREGWTYGAERDDSSKQTPCLISYRDLPENEKEYDRRTAAETLKVIKKTGYKIEK